MFIFCGLGFSFARTIIDAKVTENSLSQIKYKDFEDEGPVIIIPRSHVLSIKYENGITEVINADTEEAVQKPPEKMSNVRNNWLSIDLYVPFSIYSLRSSEPFVGIGINYERMFSPYMSLGTNAYSTFWIERSNNSGLSYSIFGIDAFVHCYPFGKLFFVGAGLGYNGIVFSGYYYREYAYNYYVDAICNSGYTITPELGIKMDAGKDGGFFLQLNTKFPIIFNSNRNGDFGFNGFDFRTYIGIGYAF